MANRHTFVASYLLVKNEFCLHESCMALFLQGVKNFYFFVPLMYWDGTSVPESDVKEIEKVADYLRKRKLKAHIYRVSVPDNEPGMYAKSEAEVRNMSLGMISKHGFEHVIIIDSDEIFRKTAVHLIDVEVSKGKKAVSLRSTPIVGFPGYPVKNVGEGLLVYVHTDVRFVHGRSTDQGPVETSLADNPSVYHFTSTRKTMKETVQKHVHSTHYKEKDYDFDKWLKDVLPTIKPGVKISHMYEKYNIWDEVRYFTLKEWNEIPKDLKPYLGGVR